MKKIEYVYRELLHQAIEKNNRRFTQSELSKILKLSLSTVNYAIKALVKMNAVEVKPRQCILIDPMKALYHWASIRNVEKDIIYSARIELPARKIESCMPEKTVLAAYSAYKFRYDDVPADYSEVYVYAMDKESIQKRFPSSAAQKLPNVYVLKGDRFMHRYGPVATAAQTFVDLWNIKTWYAKEFLLALEKRIHGILE